MGGFGPRARPWGQNGIPEDSAFLRFEPDPEQVELFVASARARLPAFDSAPIRDVLNAPESFTPDTRYILGEAPELRGFFVAAGLNSVGIALAPGIGQALAQWIGAGSAPMDLWDVDIRRFAPAQSDAEYLRERSAESLGVLYAIHWPHRQPETARDLRRSPLHDRFAARGACFGVAAGYERPNWYAPASVEPVYRYSYGRQNWFPHAASEHRAVRERVGLIELTSFAKFLIEGPAALTTLQWLCAADVGLPPGQVVYTSLLNEHGGIECDVTVTRLDQQRWMMVTGVSVAVHDLDWITRSMPPGAATTVTDVSSEQIVLGVMGPLARAALSRVTAADLSNPAFPFGTGQAIRIGPAPVWAQRIGYVGELGWELFVPLEHGAGVLDALLSVLDALQGNLVGFHAVDSLRCEKGYRSWGHDLSSHDTPLEAGLGFAVAWDKPAGFQGRDALLRHRAEPRTRRLVSCILDDPEPLLLGDEPLLHRGQVVGRVTSGAFGHTLGRSVGLGWVSHPGGVDQTFLESGGFEVEIAGARIGTGVQLRPPYDPAGERIRG
jgi:4-methylaminobutanoate oxidase (formaldehyde-forming)